MIFKVNKNIIIYTSCIFKFFESKLKKFVLVEDFYRNKKKE